MKFIMKWILILFIISFLIASPVFCKYNTKNNDDVVSFKIDVIALNETLDRPNYFYRTDYIKICYTIYNTKKDSDAIAKDIKISTKISDILKPPRESIELSGINKNNPRKIGCDEGFQVECYFYREADNTPRHNCTIDSIIINPDGNLEVIIKNLHPNEVEFICLNYSTTISKNIPAKKYYYCSDINKEDVQVREQVIGDCIINKDKIYINNNKPKIVWNLTAEPIIDYIEEDYTYVVYNGTMMNFSCEPSDLESDINDLSVKLYDKYNNSIVINNNGSINRYFLMIGAGMHQFETRVYDGDGDFIYNKSIYLYNVLNISRLEKAERDHIKDTIYIVIVSILWSIIVFYPPRKYKIINTHLIIFHIILFLIPCISILSINYFYDMLSFEYVYIYEMLFYMSALVVFDIILDITNNPNKCMTGEYRDEKLLPKNESLSCIIIGLCFIICSILFHLYFTKIVISWPTLPHIIAIVGQNISIRPIAVIGQILIELWPADLKLDINYNLEDLTCIFFCELIFIIIILYVMHQLLEKLKNTFRLS